MTWCLLVLVGVGFWSLTRWVRRWLEWRRFDRWLTHHERTARTKGLDHIWRERA